MMLFLLGLVVAASAVALARAVSQDGYGTRAAPRSHLDPFDPYSRPV